MIDAVGICVGIQVPGPIGALYGRTNSTPGSAADGKDIMLKTFMVFAAADHGAVEIGEYHICKSSRLDTSAIGIDKKDGVFTGRLEDLPLTLQQPAAEIIIEGETGVTRRGRSLC